MLDVTAGRRGDPLADHLDGVRGALGKRGIRAAIFPPPAASPMMCLWPARARRRLAKAAKGHDAVAVIGCESARATVADAVDLPDGAMRLLLVR